MPRDSMMSVCVDPKQIFAIWPHFRHWVERAVNIRGGALSDFNQIEKAILEGKSLLWLAYDGEKVHAVATTDLYMTHVDITTCSGHNLKQFLPLIKDLEQYARDEGKKFLRISGRKGWARMLDGYKQRAVTLEKAL